MDLVQKCSLILDNDKVDTKYLNEISQKQSQDDDFIQHLKSKLSQYRERISEKVEIEHSTRNHKESKISLIENNDSAILEYLNKVKQRNFLEASALSRYLFYTECSHVLPDQIRKKTSYITERSRWLAECQEQEEFLRKF